MLLLFCPVACLPVRCPLTCVLISTFWLVYWLHHPSVIYLSLFVWSVYLLSSRPCCLSQLFARLLLLLACLHTYLAVSLCLSTCLCGFLLACIPLCLPVRSACWPAYLSACLYTFLHVFPPAIPTSLLICCEVSEQCPHRYLRHGRSLLQPRLSRAGNLASFVFHSPPVRRLMVKKKKNSKKL